MRRQFGHTSSRFFFILLLTVLLLLNGCAADDREPLPAEPGNTAVSGEETLSENSTSNEEGNVSTSICTADLTVLPTLCVGDYFTFGVYEQDGDINTEPEPIEWRVLAAEDDRVLIISQYCLDAVPYDIQGLMNRWQDTEPTVWESCYLRYWLNSDFLNTAFNAADQELILATQVETKDYPEYGSTGCGITEDKIFALSFEEVFDLFADESDRIAKGTEFCLSRRLRFTDESGIPEVQAGQLSWYTRNTIDDGKVSKVVHYDGTCYPGGTGNPVGGNYYGVRPTMWINTKVDPS